MSDGKTDFSFAETESDFLMNVMPSPDLSAVMLDSLIRFCLADSLGETNGVAGLSEACFEWVS